MKIAHPTLTIVQAAVTVEDINDPTTVNAGIELIDQDAVKLQSQPLRARRVIVRLGAAMVVLHTSNLRLRTHTSVRAGRLAYVAFGPHARGTVNGLPVRPGMLLAAAPESEARFVVDAGWEDMAFLLPPEDIRAHLATRQRDHEFRMPQGVEALQVSEARARQLFDWGKRLVDAAVLDPALFNESKTERGAAEAELLGTLLATLDVANDFAPSRSDRTRQAQSLIVKVAEDHALSQTGANIYVTDLCKAAGVSERTLEYAFKAVMGLTPVAYLIRLRLHRVRQAPWQRPPDRPRSRPRHSDGVFGTLANSRAPTRTVSVNCPRIRCWGRPSCPESINRTLTGLLGEASVMVFGKSRQRSTTGL